MNKRKVFYHHLRYLFIDLKQKNNLKIQKMRKEFMEFKIWLKSEKICLKCGNFHMGNPCPSKFCPVCKQKYSHTSFVYCPYLKCQLCSALHPLKTCPELANLPDYFAKCLTCGYLGHMASTCADVHVTKMKLKFLETKYLNRATENHEPDQKEHLKAIKEQQQKLSSVRHKTCTDYFSIWLRIISRKKKRSKKKKKRTWKGTNPKKKRYARF